MSLATATTACSDGPEGSRAAAGATATKVVRFSAADGVKLVGRVSGSGDVAVILAHGFSQAVSQDTWQPFVPTLVSQGYRVLTFNFRGFCDPKTCSARSVEFGKNWLDAKAAVGFMKAHGAKKIFLVGASMGGVAVLRAARMPGVDVSGVVSLATPQFPSKHYQGQVQADDATPARLKQITEPKLFIAGTNDVQLLTNGPAVRSVRFGDEAQRMFDAAEEPKELVLVDSSFHSSALLASAPEDVRKQTGDAIFRFLSENS
jgi:predicted alpha/beta-hydrolase family hydrolase